MSDSSDEEVYGQEDKYANSPDSDEAILASEESEDSDDEDSQDVDDVEEDDYESDQDFMKKKNDKYTRFQIEKQKNDMASDIEDEEDDDEQLDSQAWGQDKKLYYNTDFVDKDYRSKIVLFVIYTII